MLIIIIINISNFYSTAKLLQIIACEVGREKIENNEWRWVQPHCNSFECREVLMGGLNTRAPIRPYVPVYTKTPVLSDDTSAVREHYKLECDEKSKY